MSNKKTFSIAVIGIPEHEQRIFKNIFKLSLYRPRSYTLSPIAPNYPVDIVILEADDPAAFAEWRVFQSQQNDTAIPTVIVTQKDTHQAQPYRICRPFVASRLLSVLDQVATQELKFIPELTIGGTSLPERSDIDTLKQTTQLDAPSYPAYTALVVDDSRPVRKQIELELELCKVQSDFAESGEQAFTLLGRKSYDIILLDVVLPGVDGYKICKTIKKDKLKRETPVIMLTSKSSPFDRIRGTFAGCDTYLTKPVTHDDFQKIIKKYLR